MLGMNESELLAKGLKIIQEEKLKKGNGEPYLALGSSSWKRTKWRSGAQLCWRPNCVPLVA